MPENQGVVAKDNATTDTITDGTEGINDGAEQEETRNKLRERIEE